MLAILMIFSSALLDHRGRRQLRKQEAGVEVGLDHPIPVHWSQFKNAPNDADPGVVDQNADRSKRLFDLFQGRLLLAPFSNIDPERQGRTTQSL